MLDCAGRQVAVRTLKTYSIKRMQKNDVIRATHDLSERIEVLLEKNSATLSVEDVATLNEVSEVINRLSCHPPPDRAMLILQWAEVFTKLLTFFEVISKMLA